MSYSRRGSPKWRVEELIQLIDRQIIKYGKIVTRRKEKEWGVG